MEPKFHYGFHERQLLIPLLRLIIPVQNFAVSFFKSDIGFIPKFSLPVLLDFPIKIYMPVSSVHCVLYVPSIIPFNLSLLRYSFGEMCKVRILFVKFFCIIRHGIHVP